MLLNETDKKTLRALLSKKDDKMLVRRAMISAALKVTSLEAKEMHDMLAIFDNLMTENTVEEARQIDHAV